jgi:hypothetical protein|mmetsp:Transcript_17005/g.30799  ORF Transcript_17005/g.30799 Transcript_17005/m.30799 type:complete len:129 (-) Transcript_17005:870-1256(-)
MSEAITKNDVNRLFLQGICPVSTKVFFWLVDTNKNREICPLDDGDTIELYGPRDSLSIRAFFVPAGSGRLELWDVDGSLVQRQTENYEPYAFLGDSGEKYNAGPTGIPLRDNILKASVYSEKVPRVTS